MNPTHIHLLINHLPVFGSILGAFVLAQGIWKKSSTAIVAAYTVFLCCSFGAGIAYLTGEPAEETVENIQGINEMMLEEHEEIAIVALIAFIILGVVSLLGLLVELRKYPVSRRIAISTLLISLVSFGIVAWTGYIGGQIRHTEINATVPLQNQSEDNEADD